MMSAASPGARCSSRKLSVAMASSTGTSCASRRAMNHDMRAPASIHPDRVPARVHRDAVGDDAVDALVEEVRVRDLHQEDYRQLVAQDLLDLGQLRRAL